MKKSSFRLAVVLLLMPALACEKILEEKSRQSLLVLSSIADHQAAIDFHPHIASRTAGEGEAASADFYLLDGDYNSMGQYDRWAYTWDKDAPTDPGGNSWQDVYAIAFYPNIVIEGMSKMEVNSFNQAEWNNVMGQALFHRARMFYSLATVYAPQYEESTAASEWGIALRLNSNFNERSVRASLEDTYKQILTDARSAVPLLPTIQIHPLRPNRAAAYGLLARILLAMKRYPEAGLYADSSLQLNNALLDFNTLNPSSNQPIPRFNQEISYNSFFGLQSAVGPSLAKVDSSLFRSFEPDDLRKSIFFRSNGDGTYRFKGAYYSTGGCFDGIATDEQYLIRAEARARAGDANGAMEDLNTLMITRWKTGTFVPFTAANAQEALQLVLTERRKELILRTLRWTDLKRLNSEGAGIVLKRIVEGVEYILPPNDPRYVFLIPEKVIELSGMPQNPR